MVWEELWLMSRLCCWEWQFCGAECAGARHKTWLFGSLFTAVLKSKGPALRFYGIFGMDAGVWLSKSDAADAGWLLQAVAAL